MRLAIFWQTTPGKTSLGFGMARQPEDLNLAFPDGFALDDFMDRDRPAMIGTALVTFLNN